MSHFTLGVVNVGGGECRGGECRTIGRSQSLFRGSRETFFRGYDVSQKMWLSRGIVMESI